MSTAEAAAVPGIFNLGFYIFAVLSGRVPGKIGFKKTAAIAAVGASAMMILASLFDSKFILYGLVFAAGIFLSLHLPSAIPWLGTLFKGGRQGFYIGIHESAAPAGQTFGPIVLALLFSLLGTQFSFLIWAFIPFLAGVGILAAFYGDKKSETTRPALSGGVWHGPSFYALSLVTVANLVGNLGVVAIVPLHLVDTFGLDKAFVATIVGVSRFLGVFGQPLGGYLHDKHGFFRMATILTIVNFLSNIYLAIGPFNIVYLAAMTVQAFATAMYFPLIYSYLVKLHGPDASRYLGKMFFIAGIAGPTTAPILAGFLAQNINYTAALLYPTALAFIGVVQVLSLSRKQAKSSAYI